MRFAILPVISMLLLVSCGIQIKEASLYDGFEPEPVPPKPERITLAVEPIIFKDDGTNFWVSDAPECNTGMVTEEVAFEGETAIKINWNRDPAICEWAGFGIGWDDWAGKDLTDVYNHAAIKMQVRSQEGKMYGLPIVLTLEDYSGNMAWSYTTNKYFERFYIDETWQKIVVPLNTFDLTEDNINIGNIKQLMFELQQAGAIYLDDIELIYFEPQPVEPWLVEATAPPAPPYPIQLFDEGFVNNDGWGLLKDPCQDIRITDEARSTGNQSLYVAWDTSKEDCYQVALGASWNEWFPADLSANAAQLFLEIDYRLLAPGIIKIGFEDYERQRSFARLEDNAGLPTDAPGWKTFRVPVTELEGAANLSDIKQFMMVFEGFGEAFFDNIRLVEGPKG